MKVPVFIKTPTGVVRRKADAPVGLAAAAQATAALDTAERRRIERESDSARLRREVAEQHAEHVGVWGRGKRSYNFA